jgi:hypothetical protein
LLHKFYQAIILFVQVRPEPTRDNPLLVLLTSSANIRLNRISFPEVNTTTYFYLSSVTREKKFYNVDTSEPDSSVR